MADYVTYKNLSGKLSILSYRITSSAIRINFKASGNISRPKYSYYKDEIGIAMFNAMKSLAKAGSGLNTFINHNKPKYHWKRTLRG